MQEKVLRSASPVVRRALHLVCRRLVIPTRVNLDYLVAYVAEGTLELRVESENLCRILTQGDVLFIRPGLEHSLRTPREGPLQLPHIHFDLFPQKDSARVPVNFKCRRDLDADEVRMIRQDLLPEMPCVLRLENHAEVKRLILETIGCRCENAEETPLLQKALVLNLLYLLHQGIAKGKEEERGSEKYRAELSRAAEYIVENSHERIDNESLARMSRLSPSHFIKLFRERYGVPPTRYHVQCRMAKARRLLLSTRLSVEEISEQTGYESIHAFCKAFRKAEGISPGRYRASRRMLPDEGDWIKSG